MVRNRVTVSWGYALLVALSACAGKELLDLGGDAGQSFGDDAGQGADASVEASTVSPGVMVDASVPGKTFPCGTNVCSPPDVCCSQWVDSVSTATCESASSCHDVVVGCTATTCPAGSTCCVSIDGGPGSAGLGRGPVSGWALCIPGGACPGAAQVACVATPNSISQSGCPAGEICNANAAAPPSCVPDPAQQPIDAGTD